MHDPLLRAVGSVVARLGEPVLLVGAEGMVEVCNPIAAALLGLPAEHLVGTTMADWRWASPGSARAPRPAPSARPDRGPEVLAVIPPGGRATVVVADAAPVDAGGGATVVRLAPCPRPESAPAGPGRTIDLTGRALAERLGPWADRLRTGLVLVAPDGRIAGVNAAAAALVGRSREDLVGARVADHVDGDDVRAHAPDLRRLLVGELEEHRGTFAVRRASGPPQRAAFRVVPVAEDGAEVEHLLVEILPDRAALGLPLHDAPLPGAAGDEDALTGLRGRSALLDVVRGRLAQRQRHLAVLHVDVDRFRALNEVHGHRVADLLLLELARRLGRLARPGDAVARLEADRFALVRAGVEGPAAAREAAQAVVAAVVAPIEDGTTRVQLTACVGVALAGPDETAESLLGHAEAAARRAKQEGRGRVVVAAGTDREEAARRAQVEAALGDAVRRGGLSVAYQPVVALASGRVIGAEALARWRDPVLGEVTPGVFVPVAEESGLIDGVARSVLLQACTRAVAWCDFAGRDVAVGVNVSPVQLNSPGLAAEVEAVLHRTGLPAPDLALEITESVVVDATRATARNLADLHGLGVRLGIDDFGTGYSSMRYLKQLPLDFVKVDRSFVDGVGRAREDTAIVRAILALAQSLDLQSIAEGIERPEQADVLRALGCDFGQGFLLGRPDDEATVSARLVPQR